MRTPLLAVLAVVAALVLPGAPAHADDYRWAVQPSSATGPTGRDYFVYDAAPGQTITDYVGITNLGTGPLTVNVYGTDAFITGDGSFALLTADRPPSDAGTWIALRATAHTIGPGERADVPFVITVPRDATPGDHVGGVVGSVAGDAISGDGQRIKVDRRVAARVYLRVQGPVRPMLSLESLKLEYDNPVNPFGGGAARVTYTIRNTGNVRLTADADISLSGPLGWRLGGTGLTLPELLPGSTLTRTESIAGVFPAARLTAEVALSGEAAVTRAASVWSIPWLLVGALVVLAGLVTWRLRRKT
ncbi:WxL protein peptidoglycan domain-containing protein [Herbidospora sp. RD11066]